ncbi:MAG TPA: YkgJ family cysteine cluster protein [Candidatus Binatia bacterium]|nr:YkgJ family cysteine cluster protein [Candidatus Binatia bacterium]
MVGQDWLKYLKFRCTGCGNCCRNTLVCVTDADVRRIAERTGKSPLAVVRFYSHDEVSMSESDPLWVKFTHRKRVMGLRSLGDHCIFLDNHTNRCTIYDSRPVTCRDHPFNVTLSDTGAVEKISLSRIVPCPHAWDGKISRKSLRATQAWNERQEESYLEKVREWNRMNSGSRTRRAFLRFLGFNV